MSGSVAEERRHGGRVYEWLRAATGYGPIFPLAVLFGLNLMEEVDRDSFGVLVPNIQKAFHLNLQGILALVALVGVAALALQVPIAWLADRCKRVRMVTLGGAIWGLFSLATGFATSLLFLGITRAGSGIGQAVIDPTHNSLVADYYATDVRPRVYSIHRSANGIGRFVGPLVAGLMAYTFGWRSPFFLFAIPTLVLVVLSVRLKEPIRGAQERRAMGASEEGIATEETAPSFAEAWRLSWKVESLRRIWYALPFLAASLVGFVALAGLLYQQVFHLDVRARGFVAAGVEPAGLVGLVIGARIATKLMAEDPGAVLRFLGRIAWIASGLALLFALAPWLWLAIVANALISGVLALILPGLLATLSLAIPARARATGFSIASLWVIPGLILLPIIGAIGDKWGIRPGLVLLTPVFLIGGLVVASSGAVIGRDIKQVWTASAAFSEVAYERRQGRAKLLLVRGLDVSYDGVQVLFGVDFEVGEGEVVALLGTNGAGKSTLLAAISGAVQPDKGAVIFDGRDTTHAPANEVAARGLVQVPGGRGVFPTLTVEENLKAAMWLQRGRRRGLRSGHPGGSGDSGAELGRVFELFPVLAERRRTAAGDLSGGQQQMLALGMALLSTPRLLMIDELALGLAPVVVDQLLGVLEELKARGVTIILVEQSVQLALTIAQTAYFMEKGEIRFHGRTVELLERPDILRSVFLEGAATVVGSADGDGKAKVSPVARPRPGGPGAPDSEGVVPAVQTLDVTRSFGGVNAVNGVSVRAMPGEIVGIIGPNGAGKTTLFDLISGYVGTSSGRVLLAGADVTRLGPDARARRGMGRSFQDARLFPSLTVEDVIAVALERSLDVRDPLSAALHLPRVYDSEIAVSNRVAELVELLGLGAYRAKFVQELSTGTRRIVDLACLLAHRPTVVLLDEPSSGIAQRETEELGPLLLRIRDGLGASLVVIEHDIPLVRSIADRLVAMDLGCVIADGPADQVLADPEVVRSYLGSSRAEVSFT
jgi:branched-chain amino acid transport system ATP-binding protein